MKLRTLNDMVFNGAKVEVREWDGLETLFKGYPFLGGFEEDPNIADWRKLSNRTVRGFDTTYEVQHFDFMEDYICPILVIWLEEKGK